jgi:signal transduction histidine kinase
MASPTAVNYAEPIVETVRQPLLVLDQAMGIRQANQAYYTSFNTSPDQTLGFDLFEVDHGRWQHPELRQILEEVLPRQRSVEDVRLEQELPGLGSRILLINARRIETEGIHQPLILLAIEDMTEPIAYREKIERLNADLERRVAERTAELEQANQELKSFTYSVSHDLRAPLRSIDGFSRILLEDFAETLPDDAARQLRIVRQSAQKMGELLDDLLAFSRMSRQDMTWQTVDCNALVQDALRDAQAEWPEHNPRIEIDTLPPCPGDANLIRQVFYNLLSNAFKFTTQTAQPHISVTAEQREEGGVCYTVADNGVGFDSTYAHKLFSVFQRLHHENDFPGTGVGLAVVQRIVQRHGGNVSAESGPEHGARLTVQLPQGASP